MSNFTLPASLPARFLVVGPPKCGKSGGTGIFAEKGFRLVYVDFDCNPEPLIRFVSDKGRENILRFVFEDKLKPAGKGGGTEALENVSPKAWMHYLTFLDTGCYKGQETGLGSIYTWDRNTILVVDSLSSATVAADERYMAEANKTMDERRRKDWGRSAQEIEKMVRYLTSSEIPCHVILIAHQKIQGPEELEDEAPRNASLEKRQAIQFRNEQKMKKAELMGYKYLPNTLGRQLPENFAAHWPTVIRAGFQEGNRGIERVFFTRPETYMDIGIPVLPKDLPETLPIEIGLWTIFEKVTGQNSPTKTT